MSVVIPTHNRAGLVGRALSSVVAQTYQNIEIIVVNDGSTDETDDVVSKFLSANTNITYVKLKKAVGGNAARNIGILAATGFFIAGLDDDDEFLVHRIETLVNSFESKYSMVASRSLLIGRNNQKKTKFFGDVSMHEMLYQNVIGNQVLVERCKILDAGLFDENLKRQQDYDMWLRIVRKFGTAKVIDDVTQLIYFDHSTSLNNDRKSSLQGSLAFYRKHKMHMTRSQKKNALCRIFMLQNKNVSFSKLMFFLSFRTWKMILKYKIRGSINRLV